ncbi:MAG: hypothetical protein WD988_01395 [Candidatus Curtissbacteria bacterium]
MLKVKLNGKNIMWTKIGLLLISIVFLVLILPTYQDLTKKTVPRTSMDGEAQRITLLCQKSALSQNCYIKEFLNLSKTYGTDFSKKVLSGIQDIDPTTNNCHTIAHSIARAAVEKNPETWQELLAAEDPNYCSGGFFHGVIEARTGFDGGFKLNGPEAEALCKEGNNPYKEGSCKHILGHLILVEERGEIDRAIKICDEIKPPHEDECYGGVFMENMVRENLKEHGLSPQYNWDMEYSLRNEALCEKQLGKAAKGCWGQMGHLYAVIYSDDPQKVFDQCSGAPQQTFTDNCYRLAVSKIAVTADQPKLDVACNVYKDDGAYRQCVSYVLSSLTTTSSKFKPKATNFCHALSISYQNTCLEILNHSLRD